MSEATSYRECETVWQQRRDERNAKVTAQEHEAIRRKRNPCREKPAAAPEARQLQSGFVEPDPIVETGIGRGTWMTDWPDLPKSAARFLKELRVLANHLQGPPRDTCSKLLGELTTAGVVDLKTHHWRHFKVSPGMQILFEEIEQMIATGVKEEPAIARAIVAFDISGKSFEAVYKRVKRMLIEYRKETGQK